MSKEGEGVFEEQLDSIKQHMIEHIREGNWALVIEMAWVQLKREGCKCLHLK